MNGEPDWILTTFIIPFVLLGVALIVYVVRQVMIITGVGPTRLEISHHPLSPGGEYDLFLSQAGRLSMSSLAVWLACDEKASYRQGTDTRIETRRVFEGRCFLRTEFEIDVRGRRAKAEVVAEPFYRREKNEKKTTGA